MTSHRWKLGGGLALLGWLGIGAGSATETARPSSALPELMLIRPDTVVGSGPPRGWSDLVLKSLPQVESGDLASLPSMARTTATQFRSVVLADVRPSSGGFTLARVGLGLCMPVEGSDTVVGAANVASSRVGLGMIEHRVYDRVAAEINRARLVARTPTSAVLAAPALMAVHGQHEPVWLVYAMIVEPESGRLQTVLWAVTEDAARRVAPSRLVRLAPNEIDPSGLDVRADRLFGAVPVSWSFAIRRLPQGDLIDTPAALRPTLTDFDQIAKDATTFEARLRAALDQPTHARAERAAGPR